MTTPATPCAPHSPTTGTSEQARAGWASPLAAGVTLALLAEGLTGLWLFALPFSVATQVQVLVHTAIGLLLVVPWAIYTWRHLRTWMGQTATAVQYLGYLLGAAALVAVTSGLLLTFEGFFGRRRGDLWVLLHQVGGLATLVLLLVHVPMAWFRRRAAARRDEPLAQGMARFARRMGVGMGGLVVVVVGLSMLWAQAPPSFAVPEGYTLASYFDAYEEYRRNPFAPTYARTHDGQMIRPEVLSGSLSCGTTACHEEIVKEWEPSAHRFSAMNPPFQQVQRNFAAERGVPESRFCAGCHDPISLFAGAKDIHVQDLSAPGMQEGCSCIVCHSISAVDQRGNADYVLTPPRKYLWEDTTGLRKVLSDFLIRVYPQQHLDDYDRNLLRTPEFCAACHKQFIPEALNRFGTSPSQNQYDEWRQSHWHTEDAAEDLSCRDCHMRLVPGSTDPARGEAGDGRRSADDGAHRHHGMIATNVLMPEVLKLPGWEKHVALTRKWIQGETVLPEIAHLWPAGPVASSEIVAPERVIAGEPLTFRVVVANRKVGHNFATGPLDFIRAWLHVRVRDADGGLLMEWGGIDPTTRRIFDVPGVEHVAGNSRSEGTMVLEGLPVSEIGMPIVQHELWKKAGGKGQRTIFAGHSDTQSYTVTVPATARGPLRIEADLCFRRYRQEFLDLVVPHMERDAGLRQPTVIQSSTTAPVLVDAP